MKNDCFLTGRKLKPIVSASCSNQSLDLFDGISSGIRLVKEDDAVVQVSTSYSFRTSSGRKQDAFFSTIRARYSGCSRNRSNRT